MKKRTRSFGSLEPLLIRNGKVITELAIFNSNGKSHKHDQWEICYVLSGEGYIIKYDNSDEIRYKVKQGSVVKLPPNTGHWMEVDEGNTMEILLVYSNYS